MIFSKNKKQSPKKTAQKKNRANNVERKYMDGSAVENSALSTKEPTERKKMTKPAMPTFSANGSKKSGPGFNPSRFSASNTSTETRKLTVGKDISLSGEIGACDHLVVEGTVEATIKGGQSLEITHTGLFKGTVEIDDAVIAGRFEGNLVVKGHLLIRSTGSVSGDVHYGDLAVEAGAELNGTINCVGLPKSAESEDDKKVGSVKPVFKTTVANEDEVLHEEVNLAPPVTASML